MPYVYPVFARGTGLGNRLFQWARAKVYCYTCCGKFVSPIWLRCSPGHFLRGTVPLNQYLGRIALARLFQHDPRDIYALRLPCLAIRNTVIHETNMNFSDALAIHSKLLYLVNSTEDSFAKLNDHQERLHNDLLLIVAKPHLRRVDQMPSFPIGINIRLGKDFGLPPKPYDTESEYEWVGWLQQTPLSWFVETLQQIRICCGWDVPAVVVSDGSKAQLHPLLELPNVKHLAPSNAIVDLLVLSRTRLLLGSGSSSFSAWAAFLGQQPAFTAPGHPFTCLNLQSLRGQMIAAFNPRQPDQAMLKAMVTAVH